MQHRLLAKSLLLFLITTCLALALQSSDPNEKHQSMDNHHHETYRDKRLIKKHHHKPGFLRTLFSVVYEQYTDTKDTIGKVNQLINDNFLPETNGHVKETTTVSSEENATTTEGSGKITRSELNRILRRNLKGLRRLFDIELHEALKVSHHYREEFRKNASIEVSKFL